MKLQQEVRGQTRDFGALRGQGIRSTSSILPIAGSDAGRSRKSQHTKTCLWAWCYWLSTTFWWQIGLHDTKLDGKRGGTLVSKREKDHCSGVNRDHQKSFKLDLMREENKTCLDRHKPGNSIPIFEGGCASKAFWPAISVEIGDGDACGSKETRLIDVLETMQAALQLPERRL